MQVVPGLQQEWAAVANKRKFSGWFVVPVWHVRLLPIQSTWQHIQAVAISLESGSYLLEAMKGSNADASLGDKLPAACVQSCLSSPEGEGFQQADSKKQ